jgi:hypothetical protein
VVSEHRVGPTKGDIDVGMRRERGREKEGRTKTLAEYVERGGWRGLRAEI